MSPDLPLATRVSTSLLLALTLLTPTAIASPVPLVLPAAARGSRAFSPSAITPRVSAAPLSAASSADGSSQDLNLPQASRPLTIYDQARDRLLSLASYPRRENWALPPPPTLAAVEPGDRAQATVPDGRWHGIGLLQTEYQAAFYDDAHDRLISLGGDHTAAWELPLTGTLAWRELASNARPAWPVGWWGSEYDTDSGNIYFEARGPNNTVVICRMEPTTGAFEPLWADDAPQYPYVPFMSMVFDPANQRFFLFGGQNGDFRLPDDLWVLDLMPTPKWSKWFPVGPSPLGRIGAVLMLDSVRSRLLIIGGMGDGRGVFALSLDSTPTWSRLSETALPGDANNNGMVLDPAADRVLALHSSGGVWAFSLRTQRWSIVPVSGQRPPGRLGVPLVMDTARHRLLVAGGRSADETDLLNDAWALSLDGTPRWTPLVPGVTRPPKRAAAGYGYDAARHRVVVFGGANEFGRLDDTWQLDLDATRWSPVATGGTPPPGRYWHATAYDPVRDQLVVFGGSGAPVPPNYLFSDLWTLSFAGDAPTWTAHEPPGPRPAGRNLSTMIYDPVGDRFILIFGSSGVATCTDLWELRFTPDAAWRLMAPAGSAPPRSAAMATYDPARDRILLFGGGDGSSVFDDTWALDLTARDGIWLPVTTLLRPPGRTLGVFELDAKHDRVLLFEGEVDPDGQIGPTFFDDVWELTLSGQPAWRVLAPAGPMPLAHGRAVGAYDLVHERLVVACGGYWQVYNDTWALEFDEAAAPIHLMLSGIDASPDRVRLVWTASEAQLRARLDRLVGDGAWQTLETLTADAEGRIEYVDRDVTPGARLEYRLAVTRDGEELLLSPARVTVPTWSMALGVASPAADVTFHLQLASGIPATLAVYDVAGRRVWNREVGTLGAGEHDVRATGASWRAGVYLARLTQAGETRSVRFAIVR